MRILAILVLIFSVFTTGCSTQDHPKTPKVKHISKTYDNGNRYEGLAAKGIPQGEGVLFLADGDRYEGNFSQGEISGKGTMIHPDGSSESGEFNNEKIDGIGVFRFSDGSFLEGSYLDQSKNTAEGKLYLNNGTILSGKLVNGKLDGTGEEILANGDRFSGNFKNGIKHGEFILTTSFQDYFQIWEDGKKVFESTGSFALTALKEKPLCKINTDKPWIYTSGNCISGLAEGQGIVTSYDSKSILTGQFKQGEFIKGQLISSENTLQQGEWKNFEPHGKGQYYSSNKLIYSGGHMNGKRHGKGVCSYHDILESCEYDLGNRIDDAYILRKQQAAINEAKRAEERRQSICKDNLKAMYKSFKLLNDINEECDINEYLSDMKDSQQEEARMNEDQGYTYIHSSTPLLSDIRRGRKCLGNLESELNDIESKHRSQKNKLTENQCISNSEIDPVYKDFKKSASSIKDQLGKYEDIIDDYDDWLEDAKAEVRQRGREQRAQMWSETISYGMEQLNSISADVQAVDKQIQQDTERMVQIYAYPQRIVIQPVIQQVNAVNINPASASSTTVSNNTNEKQLSTNNIAKRCKTEGNIWIEETNVCQVKPKNINVVIELPARACYDPSGEICNTGETIGHPQSTTISTVSFGGTPSTLENTPINSNVAQQIKGPSGAESIPVRATGTGTSMPEKIAAARYLGSHLNTLARQTCVNEHNGKAEWVGGNRYPDGEYGPFTCEQTRQPKDWWVCKGEINIRCYLP